MPIGVRWSGQVTKESAIIWVTRFSTLERDDETQVEDCTTLHIANESAQGVASDLTQAYNQIPDRHADAFQQDDVVSFVPTNESETVTEMTVDGVEVTDAGVGVGTTGLTATRVFVE